MKKSDNLDNLRHSCAHLLAAAVVKLWPNAKHTIGPAIEDGFYYDFDNLKVSEEDFPKIEAEMHKTVQEWDKFKRIDVSIHQIRKEFEKNPYKIELAEEIAEEGQKLTFYKSGDFVDLCRGGHVDNPREDLKHFKLLSVAGAYWRGDEKNKMLTRIYGTVFPTQKELDSYLDQIEEAKKRDHRKLGKSLDLFTFSGLVGAGLPLYTQKGAILRRLITEHVESIQAGEGYRQVWTPQIAKAELFKTSGHYDKYRENMFKVISNYSEEEFYLKPMNCPQHTQIYASRARSYRDLPIRMTDFAMLYRDEKPGEISGLARVRSFSQDDCHVFCMESQVDEEVDRALSMIKKIMYTYGFKYRYRLSTSDKNHPEKYVGDPKTWERVEKWAEKIMKRNKIAYFDGPGEAAFYAPKMDLMATDVLGREWQLSTVQIDFFLPERFGLTYTDKDGSQKRPVMIHRAIVGSPERFIMILLEHFAGAFPVWLSPVQVKVLPITERNLKYAKNVYEKLKVEGTRVELDDRNETLEAKIRGAQLEKIPYMLIVGEKEEKSNKISIRTRDGKDHGLMALDKFLSVLKTEISNKSLKLLEHKSAP